MVPYENGRLSQAAKLLYEVILNNDPLYTGKVLPTAHQTKANDSEFNKAYEILQSDFKIRPIRIAKAGAWNYAFSMNLLLATILFFLNRHA